MSLAADMSVILPLPTGTLFEGQAAYLGTVAQYGAFGILTTHVDFVTAIVPSVLTLRLVDGAEEIFGLNEGLLVKKGRKVVVIALREQRGDDLDALRDTVEASYLHMGEDERQVRSALLHLEADMMRRIAELQRPVL